jgi:hypothetical protein
MHVRKEAICTHRNGKTYQFAISEQNVARLPQRIADARGAIFDRIEDRVTRPDSNERRMLNTSIAVQQKLMRHADIRTTMNVYGDIVRSCVPM